MLVELLLTLDEFASTGPTDVVENCGTVTSRPVDFPPCRDLVCLRLRLVLARFGALRVRLLCVRLVRARLLRVRLPRARVRLLPPWLSTIACWFAFIVFCLDMDASRAEDAPSGYPYCWNDEALDVLTRVAFPPLILRTGMYTICKQKIKSLCLVNSVKG